MKNVHKIIGDTTIIFVKKRSGKVYEVLIDTEDLELIKQEINSVTVNDCDRNIYANCSLKGKRKTIPLHRFILCPPTDLVVDHKFHNTLDNRKSKLRICTTSENNKNTSLRRSKNTVHGDSYRGVNWEMSTGKYRAQVAIDGVKHNLGTYDTPEEANEVVVAFRRERVPFSTI